MHDWLIWLLKCRIAFSLQHQCISASTLLQYHEEASLKTTKYEAIPDRCFYDLTLGSLHHQCNHAWTCRIQCLCGCALAQQTWWDAACKADPWVPKASAGSWLIESISIIQIQHIYLMIIATSLPAFVTCMHVIHGSKDERQEINKNPKTLITVFGAIWSKAWTQWNVTNNPILCEQQAGDSAQLPTAAEHTTSHVDLQDLQRLLCKKTMSTCHTFNQNETTARKVSQLCKSNHRHSCSMPKPCTLCRCSERTSEVDVHGHLLGYVYTKSPQDILNRMGSCRISSHPPLQDSWHLL